MNIESLESAANNGSVSTVFLQASGDDSDRCVEMQAALDAPTTGVLYLDSGVFWIGRTINVPAGKTLSLDPGATIKALDTFAIIDGKNHGVLLTGDRAAIVGGTIDMNKRGLGGGINNRYNGITVLNGAQKCIRRDILVRNCTGYGVYDSGDESFSRPPSSSNYNVRTENCEIHFEPQGADGTCYIDCAASDGDGDVSVASYFHPLVGSKNITAIRMKAKGKAPAGVEMTPNIAALENITLAFCDFELTTGGVVLVSAAGQNFPNLGFKVIGGSYIGASGSAGLNNTFGIISAASFRGAGGITQTGGEIFYEGCSSTSAQPNGGSSAAIAIVVNGGGVANWNGGSLLATGGSAQLPRGQGLIRLSGNVKTTPASPAAPVIRYEQYGRATMVADGGNSFANLFLSFTQTDPTKLHLDYSIRRISDGYQPTGELKIHWRIMGGGYLRLYVTGMNLAGADYNVTFRVVEYE